MNSTVKEIYDNLQKTEVNLDWGSLDRIAPEVGFHGMCETAEINELVSYFGYSWICTDTRVGLRFYFLNDELVCASFQPGRKSDESFDWVSIETKQKVRSFVANKLVEELNKEKVSIINWDEKVSD